MGRGRRNASTLPGWRMGHERTIKALRERINEQDSQEALVGATVGNNYRS